MLARDMSMDCQELVTFGIELEDVDVALGVCYDDEELLVIREELGRQHFHLRSAFAEEP